MTHPAAPRLAALPRRSRLRAARRARRRRASTAPSTPAPTSTSTPTRSGSPPPRSPPTARAGAPFDDRRRAQREDPADRGCSTRRATKPLPPPGSAAAQGRASTTRAAWTRPASSTAAQAPGARSSARIGAAEGRARPGARCSASCSTRGIDAGFTLRRRARSQGLHALPRRDRARAAWACPTATTTSATTSAAKQHARGLPQARRAMFVLLGDATPSAGAQRATRHRRSRPSSRAPR